MLGTDGSAIIQLACRATVETSPNPTDVTSDRTTAQVEVSAGVEFRIPLGSPPRSYSISRTGTASVSGTPGFEPTGANGAVEANVNGTLVDAKVGEIYASRMVRFDARGAENDLNLNTERGGSGVLTAGDFPHFFALSCAADTAPTVPSGSANSAEGTLTLTIGAPE